MTRWSMIDWRDSENGGYAGNGVTLQAVRWTSSIEPGAVMDVQLYMGKTAFVFPSDPYGCEAILTGGGWGKRVTVDAISHPANEQVTSRTYCVEENPVEFTYKPLDVPVPDDPGDYEFRLYFQRGGSDSAEPQFPDDQSDMGLVSELVLPVTVTEEAAGDCTSDGECPDGYVCSNGQCVEDDPSSPGGEICTGDGECPEGMVCRDGECVEPESEGGSIPVFGLAALGAGAYYVSKKRR